VTNSSPCGEKLKLLIRRLGSELIFQSGLIRAFQAINKPAWRILMYHRVVDPNTLSHPLSPGMYVRPETFRMQMLLLKSKYRVISLNELLNDLKNNSAPTTPTVVITFDDGWLDNYTFAFPILKELGLPATIFIATALIGTNNANAVLDSLNSNPSERCFLNWDEISEMKSSVVSFASHSHTHRNMDQLSETEIEQEVEQSLAALTAHGIETGDIFCYPRRHYSALSHSVLSKYGFKFALSAPRGQNLNKIMAGNLILLPRIGIHQDITATAAMFSTRVWSSI